MTWHLFINAFQTPRERKAKYAFLQSFGLDTSTARRLRDFNSSKIETYLKSSIGVMPAGERVPREFTDTPFRVPKEPPVE